MPLQQYIALVAETEQITFAELSKVSAALDKQVKRDFNEKWEVNSSVNAFASLDDVPTDYWIVLVKDNIGYDAAGIHLDQDGQPYALVNYGSAWSLTASHEVLEMLADPFGSRVVAGQSPKPDQGRVNFLVEVCDPSEAAEFGYNINGVLVSDFYYKSFFDPVASPSVSYSFSGKILQPRMILRGGYLSWEVPETREWWQTTWFTGASPVFRSLGVFDTAKFKNLRSFIDRSTPTPLAQRESTAPKALLTAASSRPQAVDLAAKGRARFLREQVADLMRKSLVTGVTTKAIVAHEARRSSSKKKTR